MNKKILTQSSLPNTGNSPASLDKVTADKLTTPATGEIRSDKETVGADLGASKVAWEKNLSGPEIKVRRKPPMGRLEAFKRGLGHKLKQTMVGVMIGTALFSGIAGSMSAAYAQDVRAPVAIEHVVAARDVARLTAPQRLEQGTDIIQNWRGSGLYVKGDVGLSESKLESLNFWLTANHPHATVLIAKGFHNERWTDAEGHSYRGIDAVEQAAGKGLVALTGFGELTDARTNEHDGQIFIMSLTGDASRNNSLFYWGGTTFDNYGLGEANWQSGKNLISHAQNAMRNGGNIEAAVKNTFSTIGQALDQAIQTEKAESARALQDARSSVTSATTLVAELEGKAADFRSNHNVSGDIGRPQINELRSRISAASDRLDAGDVAGAKNLASTVIRQTQEATRSIDLYGSAAQTLDQLASKVETLEAQGNAGAASQELAAAKQALTDARTEYQLGNSVYSRHLSSAQSSVKAADEAIVSADRADRLGDFLMGLAAIAALLGAGAAGFIANRRRRGIKGEAEGALATWQKGMEDKLDALNKLRDRAEDVLGDLTSPDAVSKMYEGETLRLSNQIIEDLDQLFLMHESATGVLDKAGAQINPGNPIQKVVNLFAKGRYQEARRLLSNEPILIDSEQLELSQQQKLLGDRATYEPLKKSFEALISDFNQRAGRAAQAMDKVQNANSSAVDVIDSIQSAIESAATKEAVLQEQGGELFHAPSLFSTLIPAAEKQLEAGRKQAAKDPNGALDKPLSAARENATDAIVLSEALVDFHKTSLPALRKAQQGLQSRGVATAWIDKGLGRMSDHAESLAKKAVSESIPPQVAELRDAMTALVTKSERAFVIEGQLRELAEKTIPDVDAAIGSARVSLGTALGLAPEKILSEEGTNPSDALDAGRKQITAGRAALDRGDLDAAKASFEAALQASREARALVDAAKTSFDQHQGTVAARSQESKRLDGLVPKHKEVLESIRGDFDKAVLKLGAGDETHPNANGTVDDNLTEIAQHLSQAVELRKKAESDFQSGKLLSAADSLRQAKGHQDTAAFRFKEILDKRARLDKTVAANAKALADIDGHIKRLESPIADARTMKPTIDAFAKAKVALTAARAEVDKVKGNPFAAQAALAAVKEQLVHVDDMQRCDRDIYEEAERSITAAKSGLSAANGQVQKAQSDGHGDSSETLQAISDAKGLASQINALSARLKESHGDWNKLDQDADKLTSSASSIAAVLRREIDEAASAASAISSAASDVRSASTWTGSYGVTIYGSPGSSELSSARSALDSGNYEEAERYAGRASRDAKSAISDAESEVSSRRRAEQRRQEEERRAREAEERRRRESYSSSSSGSSGSFSSSSGGSSGGW